jgi:hypothetical protein
MAKESTDPEIEIKAKLGDSEQWKKWSKDWEKNKKVSTSHGTAGALYFAGFIGSLVYWFQAAAGFGAIITGFLKSCVWPAYIVYKLLESFYGIVH